MKNEGTMGSIDLIGRFTNCSASGHEYLLVGYNYDANAILVEPLKYHQEKTIADLREKINQQFATTGFQPNIYVLYNEGSNTMKEVLKKYTVNYQLVPPHSYWPKREELTIHKCRDHLKSITAI